MSWLTEVKRIGHLGSVKLIQSLEFSHQTTTHTISETSSGRQKKWPVCSSLPWCAILPTLEGSKISLKVCV